MLKQSINLKLGTQLKLTPQLKHSLRILQMSVMDLQQELQQQLENNVMLERDAPDDVAEPNDDTSIEPVDETTHESNSADATTPDLDFDHSDKTPTESEPGNADQWDDVPTSELDTDYSNAPRKAGQDLSEFRDFADTHTESLADHLIAQLDIEHMPNDQRLMFEYLIDALDSDGLLSDPLTEIQDHLRTHLPGLSKKSLLTALTTLQACDPAGVGARNLSECLQLQIKRLTLDNETRRIALAVAQHIDLLAEKKIKALRRLCLTSQSRLFEAIQIVRNLSPRPAASFAQIETLHIVPDVVVKRHLNQWILEINQAHIPKVHINKHYAKSIRGTGNDDLKQQLQEARWLIQGLVMRGETLIKVSQAIVSRQTGFLENGETAMQPMMMRELADILSVHESTISRVVANKYMQTPRGTYPLRFFFSSQITSDDGAAHSATAIKGLIAEMISAENTAKPFSDNKLAQMLKQKGIPVARRTVAKYREALGLASSSDRRS